MNLKSSLNQEASRLLDFSSARVWLLPGAGRLAHKAAQVLVEEVERRSGFLWSVREDMPAPGLAVIVIGCLENLDTQQERELELAGKVEHTLGKPDGFQVVTTTRPLICLLGDDPRGTLFAAGWLLRQLRLSRGLALFAPPANGLLRSAPYYRLRGHQLGYRDKTNAYDAWDVPIWDRYLRELALFGTNAIELIPPRSDDAADSVHFPLPPMDMMVEMSRLADSYGLDVWIWYPALDKDYSNPEDVAIALQEWEQVFRRLPRIDAILVPGGDPGHNRPAHLLPMLEKQTASLKRYHPRAEMWVSAQGFSQEWMNEFLDILRQDSPAWLSGVAYGPWIHMPVHEFRKLVPAQYPLRHYPDITHSLDCQYPVPDWDLAFALTEGRETINPRPLDEADIFRQMGDDVIGFLTYSEGCNDDVNKFVWSALGWDPHQDIFTILTEYSNVFINEKMARDFAQGLLALERNWVGPLAANQEVEATLGHFQGLEKQASPFDLRNWRFQQALYRAYYDAYTRHKLIYESGLEVEAISVLRQANKTGSLTAMQQAQAILEQAVTHPIDLELRTRIYQLAEALFQSIRMQLSVPLYRAQSEVRGANLDGLDYPLNDRPWLVEQFNEIRKEVWEHKRVDACLHLADWRNPGPGGYYLDLSCSADSPFIVPGLPYAQDPGFYFTPHRRFPYWKDPLPIRKSWRAYTGTLNDFPFRLHFPHIERDARYRVRIVYSDTEYEIKVRLVANGIEIHGWLNKPYPRRPLEFSIPVEATAAGELLLSLEREPGKGGLGAGAEISEIWIIKEG